LRSEEGSADALAARFFEGIRMENGRDWGDSVQTYYDFQDYLEDAKGDFVFAFGLVSFVWMFLAACGAWLFHQSTVFGVLVMLFSLYMWKRDWVLANRRASRIKKQAERKVKVWAARAFSKGFKEGFDATQDALKKQKEEQPHGPPESGVADSIEMLWQCIRGTVIYGAASGKNCFHFLRVLDAARAWGITMCGLTAARSAAFVYFNNVRRTGLGYMPNRGTAHKVLLYSPYFVACAFPAWIACLCYASWIKKGSGEIPMSAPRFRSAGVAGSGPREAKGKTKGRSLIKSGTTKVGRRFWAYEDDEGAEVFVFENDEGDIIAGPMKGSSQWLYDRFDDEVEWSGSADGDFESSGLTVNFGRCPKVFKSLYNGLGYPAKKPTPIPSGPEVRVAPKVSGPKERSAPKVKDSPKPKEGTRESSLGGCGVPTSKCSILKCRLKTDHGVWMNVPVVGGKALVYKHISGKKPFEASNFEFVVGDKVNPLLGEGMRHMESNVHDDILYFPAPQGVKSTNIPYSPVERGASVKGVLVGFHCLKDSHPTVCGGDVMPRGESLVGRHTCSTEPGYCGSLVFDQSGSHPVLVGFHAFGDDGTETNGFYKINAEMAEELRSLHFSKN